MMVYGKTPWNCVGTTGGACRQSFACASVSSTTHNETDAHVHLAAFAASTSVRTEDLTVSQTATSFRSSQTKSCKLRTIF